VKTFTGQAFRAVRPVEPLLKMPDDWWVFLPQTAGRIQGNTPRVSALGMLQGAVFSLGSGRVAVFGDAAMCTAQTHRQDDRVIRFGFNDPEAPQNAQFVLNLMHWLDGQRDLDE
jgi:hypothetical protein